MKHHRAGSIFFLGLGAALTSSLQWGYGFTWASHSLVSGKSKSFEGMIYLILKYISKKDPQTCLFPM